MADRNQLDNSDVTTLLNFFQKSSGFQQTNRFKVLIDPPIDITKSGFQIPPLFATMVQIPGQVVNYFSDSMSPSASLIDIPVKREYDNRFIIDFIVDKNWNTREFFDKWIDLMFIDKETQGGKKSHVLEYYNKIIGKVTIQPLDINNKINKTFTLYDAWPSTILPTQMMNDAPNSYLTLTVDMNYRYYNITNLTKTN
jgi:hypothetical protein